MRFVDQIDVASDQHKPWTILFYLCGDNPLDGLAHTVDRELQQVLSVGASAEAHVAVQRDGPDGCARWLLEDERPGDVGRPTRWLGRAVDSASPETLRDFLLWGLERCPSDCVALVLSGAGVLDDRAIVGTATNDPDRVFTICDDWPARSGLEIRALGQVLRDVCDLRQRRGGHPRLELVAFDMCRMQFLEVAAELHDCVELLVGPQTDVGGWHYGVVLGEWLRHLRDGWRPDARADERRRQLHALTERLVTTIGRSYRGLTDGTSDAGLDDSIVVSALDLTTIERVLGAVDTMSLAYMQALGDRIAWDARTAAVSRLGPLQEDKSYDAYGIFREVSRALRRVDIDASVAAYAVRWMCQAEPRELLQMLDVMDGVLTTWLLEEPSTEARVMGARRTLLEQWVRPAHERVRRIIDTYAGQPSVALAESWKETREAALDNLARVLGFPSLERLSLVIVSQQEAWHERRRRKRADDPPESTPPASTREPGPCAQSAPPRPPELLSATELAVCEPPDPSVAPEGLRRHVLDVWVRLLERCAAAGDLPPHTRGELVALLRERKNARHLRRLVGRTRALLAPPRPGRRRRGRFVLTVHPAGSPATAAAGRTLAPSPPRRSGLSLYRPRDLAELTRASYLALQFNQHLHWTALLTAIHLIADRPHQLWQVLSSLLASARARGRQEVLAQLAGPDAVLRIGSQFKAFAPVPMVTLSLERDTQGNGLVTPPEPAEGADARQVYLSRLMSSGREAVIHEQRCRVNQPQLDRLLLDLDRAVGRDSGARTELDALGAMLGEDVLSVLAEHLEGERQRAGDDVHLQLQLPRNLLHYPWEIVRDRHGMLGTRYAVARQVFLDVGFSGGQRVRRPIRREKLRVLIVGNPRGSSLGWAQHEAEQVLRTFRALQQESGSIDLDPDEDVFIDQPVSVTEMREWLRSGRYDVVHFCGHAQFDARHPERSAWMLSDGPLEAEQIRNTLRQSDSPPWLVYANACSAGRDVLVSDTAGDPFLQDVTGLASAFINAGVAAYVGPLWPIADSPACELATSFYEQLVVGRTTLGASLRDARLRLLSDSSYAWASLVMYGDSTATLMQRLGALLSSAAGHPASDVIRTGRDTRADGSIHAHTSSGRTSVIMATTRDTLEPVDRAADRSRATSLTPEQLRMLRSHVVNMREGRFSSTGRFTTEPADVDAIFTEGLTPAWQRAVERDEPLHVVLFAHGGLTDEASGLGTAHNQVKWWLDNRVYPIFFVWETGFFDSLQQILAGTRGMPGARDVWDSTTDLVVEAAARGGGVGRIWGAMKRSAELATDASGAARYVGKKLAAFCASHAPTGKARVALHAVGHSAGSIFHAHFLPAAFAEGLPAVDGLHLLAPAIRNDTFKSLVAGHVGSRIEHVSLFTMGREWEENDSVGPIYRKSLLYLVSRALEPEAVSPILGLESSLRADPDLTRLFGLNGQPSPHAEVIWSVTAATTGLSASTAKTHGAFDNNAPTMNSVLRRVLGRADADAIVEFPRGAEERALRARAGWSLEPVTAFVVPAAASVAVPPQLVLSVEGTDRPVAAVPANGGRRRALCVGIDDYKSAPLAGCVADARDWQSALQGLGFETTLLTNGDATRQAMLDTLANLVQAAQPGDVVVFQYAGHGTQLPDVDTGDEDDAQDEAFCPVDMDSGAYVIDDDVREIFGTIKDGVNVTCFIDCCHSGSITRAAGGGVSPVERTDRVRPRFIRATADMERAHRAFRKKRKKAGRPPAAGSASPTLEAMRQVVFSACQDREVAYESEGHGDFTVRAVELLRRGQAGLSHEAFQQAVIEAFGTGRRQNPNLECAPAARGRALLQPLGAAVANGAAARAAGVGSLSADPTRAEIAELLRSVAQLID